MHGHKTGLPVIQRFLLVLDDGILPIRSVFPAAWEINFDANTVTVGDRTSPIVADYAFDLGYDDNLGSFYIPEFPMIFSSGADSLLYKSSCFIDTGSPYGLQYWAEVDQTGNMTNLNASWEKMPSDSVIGISTCQDLLSMICSI